LILLLLLVASAGATLGSRAGSVAIPPRLVGSYVPLLLVNVALLLYAGGVGLRLPVFRPLVGRIGAPALGRALAWGTALTAFVLASEGVLQTWLGMPESLTAHALLPRGLGEKASWVVLATLIGCAEEVVYRGYLRRQLTALSGNRAFAVLMQALLFGVAHGEQGPWAVARFAAYGIAFGYVAERERSILPCVVCHVGLDVYAGLAA
jgi:membrane protease YdiL (CAAX protease family)